MTPLASLLARADAALREGAPRHALWIVDRALAAMDREPVDPTAAAAIASRLRRIGEAAIAEIGEDQR